MSSKNFIVKNGISVGSNEIISANGDVIVHGNLMLDDHMLVSSSGDLTVSGNLIIGTTTIQANVNNQANSAYNQANTGTILAQAAFDRANNATDTWVRDAANSASSYANSAFGVANTSTTNAATADQRAVTSGVYANSAFGVANTSSINALSAGVYANSAFATANSKTSNVGTVTSVGGTGTVNGITLTGTVTTSGNLTLGGTLSGVSLTTQVSGTLPIANGGTNATSAADARTNLDVPTRTGGNASGTWGISVTGSAGSALSSPLLSSLGSYVWAASTLPTSFNAGIQTSFVQPADGWPDYGSVITTRTYSSGGGSLQMYVPYGPTNGGTGLRVRFGNYDVSGGNSWTAWKTLLANDNYSGYSTFSGAVTSGGNTGFRNDVYVVNTRNPIWSFGNSTAYGLSYFQGTSGLGGVDTIGIHPNGTATGSGSVLMVTSGYTQSLGSLRAPIFYDSNDTAYYVDPRSNSVLNQINSRNTVNLMFYEGFTLDANTMSTNATGFTYSVNAPYTGAIVKFSTGGGYDLQLNSTYGGTRLAYRNRNGDIGSWYPWSVVTTYDNNPGGDLYANRFYDSSNTGYYCDPASTSRLNVVVLASTVGSGSWPVDITSVDRGIIFVNTSGSAIPLYFTVNSGGTVSGYVVCSGASTSYITSSDYRMKENDVNINKDTALAKIMSLRPVTFDWKQEFGGEQGIGFIAHELQSVAPECVDGIKDAVNDDGTIKPQGVDTSWLIPSMCAAIQKQQELIEQLMAKVAVLEGV